MNKFLFSLLCLSFCSTALADINFDQKFSCVVTESNQPSVPINSTSTRKPITLNGLYSTGVILLTSPNHPMIEFYGPLEKKLNTFTVASDYLTLAKMTGEIQGTVRVEPHGNGQILLKVAVLLMGRAYEPSTGQEHQVITDTVEVYYLLCSPE